MKYLITFICFILCSCSINNYIKFINNNLVHIQCEIVEIKEFNNSFVFTALNELSDTIFIASAKNNYENVLLNQSDSIHLNQTYNFKTIKLKIHISMEYLGGYYITVNDTIFRFPEYNMQNYATTNLPEVYLAHNTVGLYIIPFCERLNLFEGIERSQMNWLQRIFYRNKDYCKEI